LAVQEIPQSIENSVFNGPDFSFVPEQTRCRGRATHLRVGAEPQVTAELPPRLLKSGGSHKDLPVIEMVKLD
jgi:hypothetical protein